MSIPQHIIEQITDSADLVSIIGKHVELKRSGNSFKGCCPFHNEKTPSFYVKPNEGYYHCFGCKASGNAISFLMDYEGQNFLEAMDTLSSQTGIDIPKSAPNPALNYKKNTAAKADKPTHSSHKTTKTSSNSSRQNISNSNAEPEQIQPEATNQINPRTENINIDDINSALLNASEEQPISDAEFSISKEEFNNHPMIVNSSTSNEMGMQQPERETTGNLYELLERINQFYISNRTKQPTAFMYFNQRGLSEQTMNTFGLGFAPSGWQHLHEAFPHDIEGLELLGLIRNSDKNNKSFCLLRDRVIFPIRDHKGRVVGFAGRTLDKDAQPKYINSPESVVFRKQHILYGLYEGRKAKAQQWLIVEGYMDVIALYQAGIYGAVASMGTATNVEQIKKLFKQNPNLTLAFDGDNAGRNAAWRTLEISLPALLDEYELRFLILPEKEDPDSLVKAEGADAMQQRIDNAPPLSEFLISELSSRYDMSTPEGKGHLMSALKKLLKNLPEYSSYRRLLTNEVKDKLGLGYTPFKTKEQRQAEQQRVNKYRDALLNFDSQYTTESLLVYILLLEPSLIFNQSVTDEHDTGSVTLQLFELSSKDSLLYQSYQNILDSQNYFDTAFAGDISTFSHYIIGLLLNHNHESNDDLLKGLNQFIQFIKLTEADFDISAPKSWMRPLFDELCLTQLADTLKQQIAKATDLQTQNTLNQSLTQVRKRLQFRESI